MKKQKNTKEVKNFKAKFLVIFIIVDLLAVILSYYIMPLVQNFPPYSEDFAFQDLVQPLTHIQQYFIAFVIGVVVHYISFSIVMKKIYHYMNRFYRNEDITLDEVKTVRKTCINVPYKVFIVQMLSFLVIGTIFNFIMLAKAFTILKFTLFILALSSLVSLLLLIISQRMLYKVILTTYQVTNYYDKNSGYRIKNSANLLFQAVPLITIVLIIVSLIGYSKASEQKGLASANYYKAYINSKNLTPKDITEENLKSTLSSIPLNTNSDYYFIIYPNDEDIYVSSENGEISSFVLDYRDFFFEKTNGMLYEKFGIDEQMYAVKLEDANRKHLVCSDSNSQLLIYNYFYTILC